MSSLDDQIFDLLRRMDGEQLEIISLITYAVSRGDNLLATSIRETCCASRSVENDPIHMPMEMEAAAGRIAAVCEYREKIVWGRIAARMLDRGDSVGVSALTDLMNRRAAC